MSPLDQANLLVLRVCDRTFTVRCDCEATEAIVRPVFAGLLEPRPFADAVRAYAVARAPGGSFLVASDEADVVSCADADSLLFWLDKDITLTLQRERRDLFFLHAAALAWEGRVAVLPAFAGTGKSTLTLVSLGSRFDYLSDELAPIDLDRFTVAPYAHALCLKSRPPSPHTLPAGTVQHGRRFHVPVGRLPAPTCRGPLPIASIVFLRRDRPHVHGLRSISAGSAAARLMAHALNALAHPGHGLDAAVLLSQSVPCYELDITDLGAATEAIRSSLQDRPAETIDHPSGPDLESVVGAA